MSFFNFFIIRLPPEFLPVVGLLTWWCASTLGTALLCSSSAGSRFGAYIQTWLRALSIGFLIILLSSNSNYLNTCKKYHTFKLFHNLIECTQIASKSETIESWQRLNRLRSSVEWSTDLVPKISRALFNNSCNRSLKMQALICDIHWKQTNFSLYSLRCMFWLNSAPKS